MTLSRRTVVAGAAAMPVIALPAAAATLHPDPVYAAIAKHCKLRAGYALALRRYALCSSFAPEGHALAAAEGAAYEAEQAACLDVASTQPTTLAGVIALLGHFEKLCKDGLPTPEPVYTILPDDGHPRACDLADEVDYEPCDEQPEWLPILLANVRAALQMLK